MQCPVWNWEPDHSSITETAQTDVARADVRAVASAEGVQCGSPGIDGGYALSHVLVHLVDGGCSSRGDEHDHAISR